MKGDAQDTGAQDAGAEDARTEMLVMRPTVPSRVLLLVLPLFMLLVALGQFTYGFWYGIVPTVPAALLCAFAVKMQVAKVVVTPQGVEARRASLLLGHQSLGVGRFDTVVSKAWRPQLVCADGSVVTFTELGSYSRKRTEALCVQANSVMGAQ